MRASWNGYLTLGELLIPMRLFAAVQTQAPHFTQLHARDHSPVRRVLLCAAEGTEISSKEIVRAVERNGQYIELSEDELATEKPEVRRMVVRQFSDAIALSPAYYEKPYYAVPSEGGELAYTLLREAFAKTGKVAVVTYRLYEKEHVGILTPQEGVLMVQQLRFATEILPRSRLKTPTFPQPTPAEVDAAVKLVERYTTPFYLDDYRNEYIDEINEIVDRKARGLQAKPRRRVASKATPEEEVIPTITAMSTEQSGQNALSAGAD